MRIKAYIRLQEFKHSAKRWAAFVPRTCTRHGLARGEIRFHSVEGGSWSAIQRILKSNGVWNVSSCNRKGVEAFARDIGTAIPRLTELRKGQLPEVVLRPENSIPDFAPELSGFGERAFVRSREGWPL